MALTVTEKDHWKVRIEKKIDRKVEALSAASRPGFMQDIRAKARDKAIESLGIAEYLAKHEKAKDEAKRCEKEAKWMKQRVVAVLRGLQPDEVESNEWLWESEIDGAIRRRATIEEEPLLQQTELGRAILKLEAEKESLLDTVWLATSSRQVRELWQDVCRLVSEEPTALQTQALSRPASDANND